MPKVKRNTNEIEHDHSINRERERRGGEAGRQADVGGGWSCLGEETFRNKFMSQLELVIKFTGESGALYKVMGRAVIVVWFIAELN